MPDELILDGSAESGRRYLFRIIRYYRYLALERSATEEDIRSRYEKRMAQIKDGEHDETTALEADVVEAYRGILEFQKLFSTVSHEARKDWGSFFDAFRLFMEDKPSKERLEFEELEETAQLALFDSNVFLNPYKYQRFATVQKRNLRFQGLFRKILIWILIALGLPVLIVLWNLHPVFGILGILLYALIVKKRWESGSII